MSPISSTRLQCLLLLTSLFYTLSTAHLYMTYPGWRGDNLVTNGTVEDTNGLAVQDNLHPYGMQWEYPCGGLPTSTNRTKWPVGGGAVGFQPGWFQGHLLSTLYINLGIGTVPANMSNQMVNNIAINGPTNDAYPGYDVCFPQVALPANYHPNIGDNATIQVIMLAQHGAALYSCVDITFADPSEVTQVNRNNCRNDSQVVFQQIYQATLSNDSPARSVGAYVWAPMAVALAASIWL